MENTEYFESFLVSGSPTKSGLSRPHLAAIGIVMLSLGVLAGYTLAKNMNLREQLTLKTGDASEGPFVRTTRAVFSGHDGIVKALGETLPFASVTLYSKVSGYLKEILVDKGDRVQNGQVLATILSPETSSQFASALADERNKKLRSERMQALFRQGDVTDEERDQAVASSDMASAKLEELGAQKSYTTIIAPFDGTVTARFADPGALVQDAARAQSGALPIVTVSMTKRLRVTTFIDQGHAPFVRVGDPVVLSLKERPGVFFEAHVSRKAGELDTRSRTMLTEIDFENPSEEIVPGGFVDLAIRTKTPQVIQVPSESLVMRGSESYVVVVDKDNLAHYRKVEVGGNDGALVSVLSGLSEDEVVAVSSGNSLIEGQRVQSDSFD